MGLIIKESMRLPKLRPVRIISCTKIYGAIKLGSSTLKYAKVH